MTTLEMPEVQPAPASRTKRLRAATHAAHERLDQRIMAGAPFASIANYLRFLQVQHAFHRDVDPLFRHAPLAALLPDLAGRRRLDLIGQDIADLGGTAPAAEAPVFDAAIDLPTALGWLYVAEGSHLGAAFLLKEAAQLGLSENHGARHLAGAPEGRGLHWRIFTAAVDQVALSAAEEDRAIAGADRAFDRVRALVDTHFT